MAIELDGMVWVSDNQKWAIRSIEKLEDDYFRFWLNDLMRHKGFSVYASQVYKGDKLLYGGVADHDYVIVDSDRPVPKYLKNKIIEIFNEEKFM
jgi:hypothetical protein